MHEMTDQIQSLTPTKLTGSVVRTTGMIAAVAGFSAPVGALVEIQRHPEPPLLAEVVGFQDHLTIVFPFGPMAGVRHSCPVRLVRTTRRVRVGDGLLGRVVDAHGHCIDGRSQPTLPHRVPMRRDPPKATERPRIDTSISTGIQSIDGLLTVGLGQRMGIFAGSGVGKSIALGMMARYTSADVNVIGLIGERGREVNEFIERDLGPEGLARSVVVVATSDQPAVLRVQAAMTATAIAEHFRDKGKDVLFMMDSVTRFAMAQREIGLAAGEPPTTRGYPPSVFSMLPRLVERTGRDRNGSITAFYSVLVEGDDTNEPVSDTVRGLLDGHIILSRSLASKGHYPAIDVLESISRLANELMPEDQFNATTVVRDLMATYRENEDMITIGAYRKGSNPRVDLAIAMKEKIDEFLQQKIAQSASVTSAREGLKQLIAFASTRQQILKQQAAVAGPAPTAQAQPQQSPMR